MTVLGYYRFVDHDCVEDYLALGWQLKPPHAIDHLHDYGVTLFWPGTEPPPEPRNKNREGT
jgi:hypothetical protein